MYCLLVSDLTAIFPQFSFWQFTEALNTGYKTFPADNLTGADHDFLKSIFISAPPGEALIDFSTWDDEKLQGYAIVLKIIAGESFFKFRSLVLVCCRTR